ncbi:DLA class II histocompatibility antigen, DR-1 beta chain, partial [Manacus vitellinus]
GAPPDPCPAHTGVFQRVTKRECHFINSTERVRLLERYIYNREQLLHFDSDVGVHVEDTPHGEKFARSLNSQKEYMEYTRSAVDWYCLHNYRVVTPFTVERRVHPNPSQSLQAHPMP